MIKKNTRCWFVFLKTIILDSIVIIRMKDILCFYPKKDDNSDCYHWNVWSNVVAFKKIKQTS